MPDDLSDRSRALVAELGLAPPEDIVSVRPLTGGVASDIGVVDLGTRRVCVKFALPKLKVATDWEAPVHRNAAEYAWLTVAATVAPESAVRLLGRSQTQHGFAMEFMDGPDVYLWKARLLEGAPRPGEAARVASLLGRIHAASAAADFNDTPFRNRADFHALRVEPYLLYTVAAHPELAPAITPIADALDAADTVLIHGDASPKNILFRGGAPILLDAECATMGDASFDPAFCINHLFLKAIHLPAVRTTLLTEARAFWASYADHVTWEDRAALEARVAALLPVLMLARVDGRSPVEYLSEDARKTVRHLAIPLIRSPVARIGQLIDRIDHDLNEGPE